MFSILYDSSSRLLTEGVKAFNTRITLRQMTEDCHGTFLSIITATNMNITRRKTAHKRRSFAQNAPRRDISGQNVLTRQNIT